MAPLPLSQNATGAGVLRAPGRGDLVQATGMALDTQATKGFLLLLPLTGRGVLGMGRSTSRAHPPPQTERVRLSSARRARSARHMHRLKPLAL